MGMGLNAAKAKLKEELKAALNDAFKEAYKATFIYGGGDEGDSIAAKFAKKGAETAAGPIADAILNFVSQAQITGQNAMVSTIIAPPITGGPCTGVLAFTLTELSLM